MSKSKTLLAPVSFSGAGIHKNLPVTVTVYPLTDKPGLYIRRCDLDSQLYQLSPMLLRHTARATSLQLGDNVVMTPEHLLSALCGAGIRNAIIEVDADEMPILDGSAKPFLDGFAKTGVQETDFDEAILQVKTPLLVQDRASHLLAVPENGCRFTYVLQYPGSIGEQLYTFSFSEKSYADDIAPARTFGLLSEVDALKSQGLALGGSLENAVVFDGPKSLNRLRFENEPVRHKILDMIGDLAVVGQSLRGHFIGFRSGHTLNAKFAAALFETGTI